MSTADHLEESKIGVAKPLAEVILQMEDLKVTEEDASFDADASDGRQHSNSK